MSVSIRTLDRPEILEIHLRGSFDESDLEDFDELLSSKLTLPKMRLLLRLEDFDGWETIGAFWKNLGLVRNHREQIERVAAVADKTWQEVVVELASPFGHAETETFPAEELSEARVWLHAEGSSS